MINRQGLLSVLDQAIMSGSNFVTVIIAARMLDVASFAELGTGLIVVYLILAFHMALFTQPLCVLGARETAAEATKRFETQFTAHAFVAPAVGLLLAACAFFLFTGPGFTLALFLFSLAILGQELVRKYWYARRQIGNAIRCDMVCYGGSLVAIAALAIAGELTAVNFLLVKAVFAVAGLFQGWRHITRNLFVPIQAVRPMWKEQWYLSKWLAASALLTWLSSQSYTLMLKPFGAEAVAAFVASLHLVRILGPVMQIFNNFLPAHISATRAQRGMKAVLREFTSIMVLSVALAAVLGLVVFLYSSSILSIVYAEKFTLAPDIFGLLTVSALLSVFSVVIGAFLLAMDCAQASFYANAVSGVATLTIGLFLVAAWGLYGAAIGAVVSQTLCLSVLVGMFVHHVSGLSQQKPDMLRVAQDRPL